MERPTSIIGVISDTHGQLRPEALAALADVQLILHAGDVGGDDILDALEMLAPVRAVAGNTDPPGNPRLPSVVELDVAGVTVHVSHGHEIGVPRPAELLAAYPADVIVFGHTHRPLIHREGNRLVLNPGAAGPRRFDIQPSVALLKLGGDGVHAELLSL